MKKKFAYIGIVFGIITIILGITLFGAHCGVWQDTSTSFGGDFYTYSYRASARAADNVFDLAKAVTRCFAYLLISLGAFQSIFFACLIAKDKDSASVAEPVEVVSEEVPSISIETSENVEEIAQDIESQGE